MPRMALKAGKSGEEVRVRSEPPTPCRKGDLHALRRIPCESGESICEVVVNAAPIAQPHQLLHCGVRLGYINLRRKRLHREIPKAKRSNKHATLCGGRGGVRAEP